MTPSNENDAAVNQEPGRTRKAKVPVRKPPLGKPGAIATSTRQAPLDAFTFLVGQHDELRGLFAEFARTGTGCVCTRRLLLDELAEKLENHLRLKERLVVPLHRRVNDDGALQCVEEMALMRALLRRIVRIEVSDKSLGAKVKLLEQLVLHHIDTEEKSHIPRLLERQPLENYGFLGVKMEEESRRLRGLHERRLRLREHRRWLASREKNNRRFFGGYAGGRDEFLGFGF
ncbi:MAG: hemerythrin domain-containing protein [Silvanigrellales bacterium]|nr:hemerythrin domain-containing protein [Silvanigrellales bacterium]